MPRVHAFGGWDLAVPDVVHSDAQLTWTQRNTPWVTIMLSRDDLISLRKAIGETIMAMDQRDYGRPREDDDD